MKNLLGKVRKIKNTADENELVTDYMFTHYDAPENHMCTLCGQRGIIDTRGVKTPAGVEVGRLNWCLCPNGQAMREQAGERLPADFPEYTELMLTDSVEQRVLGTLLGKTVIDGPAWHRSMVTDAILSAIQGKVIKLTWGPDSGRPAGYYVSVPELGSCEVIKVSDLREALGKE
jgi:hypothetical protein